MKKILFLFIALNFYNSNFAQNHSVAREWNEQLLQSIREDLARPTVHARNLHHLSIAMYDAWAVYNPNLETYFLGNTLGNFTCTFSPIDYPADIEAAREEAISYASYRLLRQRFLFSPNAALSYVRFDNLMDSLGYDKDIVSVDYINDGPAALGNYIAQQISQFGLQDGSNEQLAYTNQYYQPFNTPLITDNPGNPTLVDPNRWQPLTLDEFIDQSGNPIPVNTPSFLSPEWGNVFPFALSDADKTVYNRDGYDYNVYHDPGMPPLLDTTGVENSDAYIWGFALVSAWSSHLDPADGVMIDISPASIGNIQSYPTDINDYPNFYDLENGGDPSIGHSINPKTGQAYTQQMVARGDYARVLAEFWADGPDSETPPGHWFTLLNYVNDHPDLVKKYRGSGEIVNDLEWDIKAYFILGGAMHDAAVATWGMKGWYDYIRPISAIRYMGDQGQSSIPSLANYDPAGLPLIPGYIEIVEAGDPLAGASNEHVNKIKLYAWKGPDFIVDPLTDVSGVDWILAENWWPYQRPSFVTPNFSGYISGHSTFSSTAAKVLETITGDPFFPGGLGEFNAEKEEFLVFEDGPSNDVILQWATYKDASDQTSLSRIWGGIHPPADDIPGRHIGENIGTDAIVYAETFFLRDDDNDGVFTDLDCNDDDPTIYPNAPELCDGKDNDCNGQIDDNITFYNYYIDLDGDGFGTNDSSLYLCQTFPPEGMADNANDCDDTNPFVHPNAEELCDFIDNNCDNQFNEGLPIYTYYRDTDLDGYGGSTDSIWTCRDEPQFGFSIYNTDCDDNNATVYPTATDIPDNGIDEDCNGIDYFAALKVFPNPVQETLTIHYDYQGQVNIIMYDTDGRLALEKYDVPISNILQLDVRQLDNGVFILKMTQVDGQEILLEKITVL